MKLAAARKAGSAQRLPANQTAAHGILRTRTARMTSLTTKESCFAKLPREVCKPNSTQFPRRAGAASIAKRCCRHHAGSKTLRGRIPRNKWQHARHCKNPHQWPRQADACLHEVGSICVSTMWAKDMTNVPCHSRIKAHVNVKVWSKQIWRLCDGLVTAPPSQSSRHFSARLIKPSSLPLSLQPCTCRVGRPPFIPQGRCLAVQEACPARCAGASR